MPNTAIQTAGAPAPIGPYSQAIRAGNLLFVSGQIALDAADGTLQTGDIATETRKVMENLKAILTEAGTDFSAIVKTTIFLMDMGQFAAVNAVYADYFTGTFPARETVQVAGLPRGVNVEISVVAVVG